MRTSESIKSIAAALGAAQAEITPPVKDKEAKAGSYSYKYADLGSVIDALKAAFKEHHISYTQATDVTDAGMVLHTRLMHAESGEWIEGVYPLPPNPDPQKVGSALTYARRYSLCALVGITAEDDDDGQAAKDAGQPQGQKAKPPVIGALNKSHFDAAIRAFERVRVEILMGLKNKEMTYEDANARYSELRTGSVSYQVGNQAAKSVKTDLLLQQCRDEFPSYWQDGEDHKGIETRLKEMRDELTPKQTHPGIDADSPETYAAE